MRKAPRAKRIDMIWAAGTPPTTQLPVRRFSRRNRTIGYQMKKTRAWSPGRSGYGRRRDSQMRKSAPAIPLTDSYRKSGWKAVVASGNCAHGYWARPWSPIRWAQSIAMPHGRVVGGP